MTGTGTLLAPAGSPGGRGGASERFNAVIDLSHHNRVDSFPRVLGAGILAVIHKASQGFSFDDPRYAEHRRGARACGLRWGGYHFGVGGDGAAQAAHFLQSAAPKPGDLLVLDLEANPTGSSMGLDDAEEFAAHVQQATGRWPGLYGGSYLAELVAGTPDTVLGNCWLWIAPYGAAVRPFSPWRTWTLWQYTDGAVGPEPHSVDGIGPCDRDSFNGSRAEFDAFWESNAIQ